MKIGFDLISDLNLSPNDSFNWENKATSLYCIIAGNPARVIKKLNKDECVKFKLDVEYHGYISNINFTNFRSKYLNI
jgi:hypothetical protein